MYLSDELSEDEAHLFDQYLESNPDVKILLSQEIQLRDNILKTRWDHSSVDHEKVDQITEYLQGKHAQELRSNLREGIRTEKAANANLPVRDDRSSSRYLHIVLLLLVLGFLAWFITYHFQHNSSNDLYATYLEKTSIPSLIQKSSDDDIGFIEVDFRNENYPKVIDRIITIDDWRKQSSLYYFLGFSHCELGNLDEAKKVFERLANSQLLDAPFGDWYLVLMYLDHGDTRRASRYAKKITEDTGHPYYTEASQLIRELK